MCDRVGPQVARELLKLAITFPPAAEAAAHPGVRACIDVEALAGAAAVDQDLARRVGQDLRADVVFVLTLLQTIAADLNLGRYGTLRVRCGGHVPYEARVAPLCSTTRCRQDAHVDVDVFTRLVAGHNGLGPTCLCTVPLLMVCVWALALALAYAAASVTPVPPVPRP
jgi:hypothetical protein